jgi:hypothetical protein
MLPPRYPRRASWTAEEDALLKQGVGAGEALEGVAERLDRTVASVQRRMTRLKLRRVAIQVTED